MSADELEHAARKGEEVGRLLACGAVREMMEEMTGSRREAIMALAPGDFERFRVLKAGLEALEEFMASLESVAAHGEEARRLLMEGPERGRVL